MRLEFRSPAARRALLSLGGVGLIAVALAVFSHQGRREARLAAIVVALDIFFVLAGSRAPRVGAMAALTVLAIALGLTGLASVLLFFVALLHDVPIAGAVLGTLPFVVICVLQWLSFRAVAENDRLHE